MNKRRTVLKKISLKRIQLCSQKAVFFVLFSIMMFAQLQAQNDWNQFRGSQRNGVLTEANLPDAIPKSGPELLWTQEVGEGFPEVIFADDILYLFSSDSLDGGYEYVAALKPDSGEELWKTKVDSMWFEPDGWGHGPRSTPVVDKKNIYCLSGYGKFSALSKANGKVQWTVNLPEEYGSTTPRWGFSSSPLVVEDVVILETGGTENRAFTAYNKKNGKVKWSKGKGKASYNSPILAKINNQTQIIFAIDTLLYAFNPKGEELWAYRMPLSGPMAMPVFIAPNKIFVSSVSRTGSFIVELDNNQPTEILSSTTMQNNWSSSCYRDGYLYGFSKAKLQCVSTETGEMTWGKRGFGKGSLIMVDDKLLVLSDRGKLIVVEATPKAYNEVGSFQALEGKSWTAPSYYNGKLFVRNLTQMSCYKFSK